MAGYLHRIEQRRLIDSDGIADGASIFFYLTTTNTFAPIYSDQELTVPLANPVVVGAGAAVPDIYLDDEITYRRVISYLDGTSDDTDPYAYRSDSVTSDLVHYTSGAAGAVQHTLQSKLGEVVSVKDFGAVGNAANNDLPAIEAAITATGQTSFLQGGSLFLPRGQYATSETTSSSQFWRLDGSGPLASFFVNTGPPETDLFTNGGFGYAQYANWGARNYHTVLKSSGQVESSIFDNLHIHNSTGYAFDVAGHFLVLSFQDVIIDGGGKEGSGGIKVGGVFNHVEMRSPQFLNLDQSAFDLSHSEGVVLSSMRVEGPNTRGAGTSVFKLAPGSRQHIITIGGYFEGAHEWIVSADGAGATKWEGDGLISFIGTHFTFWEPGGQHKWATTRPVPVMACDFEIATRLPPTAQAIGYSYNLIRSEYVSHTPFVSRKRRPASVSTSGVDTWVQDVLVLQRPDTANTPANFNTLIGELTYAAGWSAVDGGAAGSLSGKYLVTAHAVGGGNIDISVTSVTGSVVTTGNGASALQITGSGSPSPSSIAVIANWTGINPTTINNFDQQWSFTWNQSAGIPENTFSVSEPSAP